MSLVSLKPYQSEKVEELTQKMIALLSKNAPKMVCVFKSPTGSGKTVIIAKMIENLVNNFQELELSFLWVSIGKGDLHFQSKRSLENIFEGSPLCSLLESDSGGRREILQNEVLVVNWEKLRNKSSLTGEWTNKLMQEGETESFVKILERTRDNRKVILIIDESHYASDAARTKELREIISADVTLEMSATPKLSPAPEDIARGTSAFVMVEPEDVIEAGMIKKEILVNPGVSIILDDDLSSQEAILEAAFNRRKSLQEKFQIQGSDIVPLCLIQLPNSEEGDSKRESVEDFLRLKGVTTENQKLAIWLSSEKSDFLQDISDNNNNIEFLVFKQAIDTGWDCPRAQVLVKLRETQSYVFEVQTLGRILRMPEQRHYLDDELNIAYVYTNLKQVEVHHEEFNPNMVKHLVSSRKQTYSPVLLNSYHRTRIDYGDVTYSFQPVMEKVLCDYFQIVVDPSLMSIAENFMKFSKKVNTDFESISETIFSDLNIQLSTLDGENFLADISDLSTGDFKLSSQDIYASFNFMIRSCLQGFAPKRSIPTIRQAIYGWFKKYLGFNLSGDGISEIQMICLHQKNFEIFSRLLAKSIENYRPLKEEEVLSRVEEISYEWEVSEFEYFNQYESELKSYTSNVYEPVYVGHRQSAIEKSFEEYLETKSDLISWWFKNGENRKEYLGIKYIDGNNPRTFYPDYLIQLKSGALILGDTKSGITLETSFEKAIALENYIVNSKKDNLHGGIIAIDNSKQWRIQTEPSTSFDTHNFANWSYFDELLSR